MNQPETVTIRFDIVYEPGLNSVLTNDRIKFLNDLSKAQLNGSSELIIGYYIPQSDDLPIGVAYRIIDHIDTIPKMQIVFKEEVTETVIYNILERGSLPIIEEGSSFVCSLPAFCNLNDLISLVEYYKSHEYCLGKYIQKALITISQSVKQLQVPHLQRIGILTCMWQRPELTNTIFSHYKTIKKQLCDKVDLIMYAVGSEGDTSRIIAEQNGFSYVEWPNQPLGAKWNAGLRAMRNENIDAVLIVGSDDFINAPLIELYARELAQGKKFLGILDMYFFDLITRRLMHWKGYTNERKGEVIGLGRCIHRDILEAASWTIWEDWRKSSLDYSMLLVLADVLKPVYAQGQASFFYCQDHGIAALDVKLSHNINSFDYINHSTDCEAINHVTWLNKNYPGPLVDQLLGLTSKVVIVPVHAHDLHGDAITSMALIYAKIAEKYPETFFNTLSTDQIKQELLKSKTWEDILSLMLDKKDRITCREVLHCLLLLNPNNDELRKTLDMLS